MADHAVLVLGLGFWGTNRMRTLCGTGDCGIFGFSYWSGWSRFQGKSSTEAVIRMEVECLQ